MKTFISTFCSLTILGFAGGAMAEDSSETISSSENYRLTQAGLEVFNGLLDAEQKRILRSDDAKIREYILDVHSNAQLAERARALGLQNDPLVAAKLHQARTGILVKAYMDRVVAEKRSAMPDFSDRAREYYNGHLKRFQTPESREVSHILLLPTPGCSCESRSLDERIAELKFRVLAEDFGELAGLLSQDAGSAKDGGRIAQPILNDGSLDDDFAEAVFAIPVEGMISDVVFTKFGAHVIRLDKINPPRQKPFDEVEVEIIEELQRSYLSDAIALERGRAYPDPTKINIESVKESLK